MSESKLYPHQQQFIDEHVEKPRVCLYWDCRTGKSKTAELWMRHPTRNRNQLAIVLKKNKQEWIDRLPDARVYTKEEIKAVPLASLRDISAILIDECHFVAGSLFIAKTRSALSERVYHILKQNTDAHVILLSATPVTNAYHSLHTLMVFLGVAPAWKEYQKYMAALIRNPFIVNRGRQYMWQAKKDWRIRARKILDKYAMVFHRVRLADCVDSLPPEIIEVVSFPRAKKCGCDECHWTHDHKYEQKAKIKWLQDNNFDKLIIACHYQEQVQEVSEKLGKTRNIYTVYGATKNPEEVIAQWQQDEFGYLVVSSSMGEGFDGYSADALVFMSLPHKTLAHTQMKERLTTLTQKKPKLYYYLLGGTWDKKIYTTVVQSEKDFYGDYTKKKKGT